MTRLPVIVAFLTVFAAVAALQAQTPAPRPTPPADGDVVKISTTLIQLDLTVTDSKGKPIVDLRPDEVEIYENGQKQKITALTFVAAGLAASDPVKRDPKSSIPTPAAVLRPEQVRRTVALVVDDISLSFVSAYRTRNVLKKFVDSQMQDGDLVAIIRTGAGIGALQQFTSDKRVLYAAIEKVKWNPLGNGGISAFAPLESVEQNDPEAAEPEPGERTAEGTEREFNDFRESYFSTGTLGAINYVVRGMSELPGRKSVILFSDGFALNNIDAQGFTGASAALDPLKRLIDAANRSSVVIYAMDPRGLIYTGLTAADNTGGRSMQQLNSALSDRRAHIAETQQSLRYIAEETGGFALVNNNDLSSGVKRVLEDQSHYLIAYEPDEDTFDVAKRRFNKIEIKVLRGGATARYRSGFFNVPDRETPVTAAGTTPMDQLEYALVSPFSINGINLRLNALFGSDARNPQYVRSLLHVNAADLKAEDGENGIKKIAFEVLAMSFGDNGQVIDRLAKVYTVTVKPNTYKKMLADGFVYHFLYPVKKPGAYQYRVALRDTYSGKVGSASQFIEVPDINKKRLAASSIVLESLSAAQWRQATSADAVAANSDPMTITALRRIRRGTVLRYGYEIYNAQLDEAKRPAITTKIRVFRDGEIILDGKETPLELRGQTDLMHIKTSGAIAIGTSMAPGDYILQVIVTDAMAKKKPKLTTQFVQFEVVAEPPA